MPKLHDFRADFSAGRTGKGLRIRQDTAAYRASVFDCDNMMVEADGKITRRFGTLHRLALGGETRLETWKFSELDIEAFILLFSPGQLLIYDMTLTLRATLTSQPWTADAVPFLTLTNESNRLIIADQSFRTQMLAYDAAAGTFSITPFAFDISGDGKRVRAPFYQFSSKTMKVYPTNFLSEATSTGYGGFLSVAYGTSGFDLSAGTGALVTDEDFFEAGHVGSRMRLGAGEFEITAVTDARNASVKVYSEIARQLDTDPFYFRKDSGLCEVACFDHGLNSGDWVFFMQVDEESGAFLSHALKIASSSTVAPPPLDGAAAYKVLRVIDKDHFEIQFQHPSGTAYAATATWASGVPVFSGVLSASSSLAPTNDIVSGGSDVMMAVLSGMTDITEPAFSDVRGWPQACAIHETRLWLGGTRSLPDSVWASRLFNVTDFDPGDGAADDALTLYGIGDQSRVRHIVPGFDTMILTDNGEYYIPGSVDAAITPATARAIPATKDGSAYTTPFRFDGGLFFVDAEGQHVRELVVEGESKDYNTNPATIVVDDWVKGPKDATMFQGSPFTVTPYLIWVNSDDGSLLVMHSRRRDKFFGFMRWTLGNGEFVSVTGIKTRLFAVVKRGADYFLVEFDTSEDYITMDFGAVLTADPATTSWSSPVHGGLTVQMESNGNVYTPAAVDMAGSFTTPEAVTLVRIGEAMPWSVTMHPAIAASGQGPKAGKFQRLVDAEVHWVMTTTGTINGESILNALDVPALSAPTPVDDWRQHIIGEWGREPRMIVEGTTPGKVGMRGAVLNVYF